MPEICLADDPKILAAVCEACFLQPLVDGGIGRIGTILPREMLAKDLTSKPDSDPPAHNVLHTQNRLAA
jgi:hypothetical protein